MLSAKLAGMLGFSDIEHIALTQYSLCQGLERYGQAATNAVYKEMKQLHNRKTIRPRFATDQSPDDKGKSLAYLMFIKKKQCGTIKGRGCADSRKQRLYKTKEETSSPTIRTKSLLLSCVIDAKEGRHVMTCDVAGAFMQVDVNEVVHVRLTGAMAELLAKVDPKLYDKYIVMEQGKPSIYMQLQKALYGTLTAPMLFWKDLSGRLAGEGYVANPYNCCMMNKVERGKQSTVLWHVDDLKALHIDNAVNKYLLNWMNKCYEAETPLTVTRGDIHKYLGMTIDHGEKGKVEICMDDYVGNILDEANSDMDGHAITPAAKYLLKANENSPKLNTEESMLFHSSTAKLLFYAKGQDQTYKHQWRFCVLEWCHRTTMTRRSSRE